MNTNKILLGLAKSDPNYGLSSSKDFAKAVSKIYHLGIGGVDTSPSYKNNYKLFSKIENNQKLKFYTKLPKINLLKNNLTEEVKKIISKILKKNKIKFIHCLIIHDPLLPLSGKKWFIIYNCLKQLKKKGLIKQIGVSVYNKNELDNILLIFKPDLVQFPLNVFNQEFYNLSYLKKLKERKITLVARSIFLQGLLCKKKLSSNYFFKPWSDDINNWFNYVKVTKKSAEELCLSFVLSCKYLDHIILGIDNLNQLKKNLKVIKKVGQKNFLKELLKFNQSDPILIDPRFWFKNENHKDISTWVKTNKYIMSGGMLLSKKPYQFLPGLWPSFYKKAKGCFIWDNFNKKYLDFSLMGVGTNIVGYSNSYVNSKLKKVIDSSNVSSLNSNYDLILSKKLLNMHRWASKCFYARTGGEANAIALRIARCFTKKDEVAICGYHGWHDWYLSSNIKNKNNLDNLLLPGLSSSGIPKKLAGVTHTFKYNDFKSLKKLVDSKKNIGTIFMEVQRNEKPKKNFLKKVRDLSKKKGIVLIFDECTSGFRETFGGLHKKYKVNPDIAVFGKSLSNGVPLTAIIGKEDVMRSALKSFISSTFWTDALGPSAAIATLDYMAKTKSWKNITSTGKKIKNFWRQLSKKYKLKIVISGLDAMPMFNFISLKNDYYKNFITQEMLKKNILASNVVYCSIDHHKYLKIYFKNLEKIFKTIKNFEKGVNVLDYLSAPNPNKGFKRLN